MITSGPGDRDGGLAATARAEDARRPSARADATELRAWSEAQWKCWLATRCGQPVEIIIVSFDKPVRPFKLRLQFNF